MHQGPASNRFRCQGEGGGWFSCRDKAKKEAQSIAKDGEANVASLKEKAMANVDDAASIIVKNVL